MVPPNYAKRPWDHAKVTLWGGAALEHESDPVRRDRSLDYLRRVRLERLKKCVSSFKIWRRITDPDPVSLLKSFLILVTVFGPSMIYAANGVIVHATRRLRMSHNEPISPKDFYVNLGQRQGLQPGDLLAVARTLPVPDSKGDGSFHLITVAIGHFRVLIVGETASIGHSELVNPASQIGSLQYTDFMVGDEVFPKTSLPSASAIP